MKRRDFLKLIGVAIVAPGTVVAAVKGKPKRMWLSDGKGSYINGEQSKGGICGISKERVYMINHPSFGVTDKQLRELATVTLKDLPGFYDFRMFPTKADRKKYRKDRGFDI